MGGGDLEEGMLELVHEVIGSTDFSTQLPVFRIPLSLLFSVPPLPLPFRWGVLGVFGCEWEAAIEGGVLLLKDSVHEILNSTWI